MRVFIRGLTAGVVFALAMVAGAQQKDTGRFVGVASGQTYTFTDNYGSGTITLAYSFSGSPSSMSIVVQGCAEDGTNCTTLSPITGSAPYTSTTSGQQQFLGGYNQYKVTATFTGGVVSIYKVGIQAFVSAPGGSAATLGAGANLYYLPYLNNGTGTTLVDQTGNGNNCVFGSGAQAPTFTASGAGLFFSGVQNCAIATGLTGSGLVEMWLSLGNVQLEDGVNTFVSFLTNSAGLQNGIIMLPETNGILTVSSNQQQTGTVRLAGPSSFAYICPTSGSTVTMAVNGQLESGYINPVATCAFTSVGSMMGDSQVSPNQGFGGTFTVYAVRAYPQSVTSTMTTAQIKALIANDDLAVKTVITQATGVQFPGSQPSHLTIIDGDSNFSNNGGSYALQSSVPFLAAQQSGEDQYTNLALFGQSLSQEVANLATTYYPQADVATSPLKIFFNNAGENDLKGGASAATVLATVESYCSTLHARYPSSKVIVGTAVPNELASGIEAQRQAFNTSLISARNAGTLGCDAVYDIAADPIVATTFSQPNNYTTSTGYNSVYSPDGNHMTPLLSGIVAPRAALAILEAKGELKKPYWLPMQIPFSALAINTTTSFTLPVINLPPTWQVCGAKATVKTAFAGTSISALTITLGDSTGTATQYLASQSLLTTTSAANLNPNFASASGIVRGVFTATGGNLSALTAGLLDLDVCVMTAP